MQHTNSVKKLSHVAITNFYLLSLLKNGFYSFVLIFESDSCCLPSLHCSSLGMAYGFLKGWKKKCHLHVWFQAQFLCLKPLGMCKTSKKENCCNFLWLMEGWRKVFCRKFTNWEVFVSEYRQQIKSAAQQHHELMRSSGRALLDRKWNNKPFVRSQMGMIMSLFYFQDVWFLTFERYSVM